MRGRRWGVAVVGVLVTSTLATGVANGTRVSAAILGYGRLRGIEWAVEAVPDEGRKGICFGVGYGKPITPDSFDVQCSAPAERRGIVISLESEHRRSNHGAITVVGMAMNAAVAKVEAKTCAGKLEVLHPKKPRGPGSGLGHIAAYRYFAFAVRGPWCAEEIVTYGRAGEVLFEGRASEL